MTEGTTTGFLCWTVFSILAPARTSGNVLYGLYTCICDRFMFQWPAQLPIAGGNHRFQCARVQRDRGRCQIGNFREMAGGGVGGTFGGPENRKFVRIENVLAVRELLVMRAGVHEARVRASKTLLA